MIDSKKINMNELPKKFCDGAIGGFGKDLFSFALTSGNNLDPYATTPQMMKSIATWMNDQIQGYEKMFGTIDMTPPEIQSPLQISDIKKPGEDKK